jgi:hypothetical protein
MNSELNIAGLVEALADPINLDRVQEAAVLLSKGGANSKAMSLPRYGDALNGLLEVTRTGDERDRMVALAVLGRLRKQQRKPFDAAFAKRLMEPMRPLALLPRELPDPKVRDYLAQALRLVRFEGQSSYLAEFVASESANVSLARNVAAEVLVDLANDLGVAFEHLGEALKRQPHETKDQATSRAIRLTRTLEALLKPVRLGDEAAGRETGKQYAAFLRDALGSSGDAERPNRIAVANAALELLDAWVRPHFSLSRHSETFAAVDAVRRLFLPARWPDETATVRIGLGRLVREAILILAETGVTDEGLRRVLFDLVEDHRAKAILRQMAASAEGLPNHVRHWLETGKAIQEVENVAALGETVLGEIDVDLAEAFRDAAVSTGMIGRAQSDLQEVLEEHAPALASELMSILSFVNRLGRRLESIAAKRGFELRGEVGATVEYAPVDHQSDQPIAGVRIVRMVLPRVVRRSGEMDRTVLKARVTPL